MVTSQDEPSAPSLDPTAGANDVVHPVGSCHVLDDFEWLRSGCSTVIDMDHEGLKYLLVEGEPDSAGIPANHRRRIVEGVVSIPGDLLELLPGYAVVGTSLEEQLARLVVSWAVLPALAKYEDHAVLRDHQ